MSPDPRLALVVGRSTKEHEEDQARVEPLIGRDGQDLARSDHQPLPHAAERTEFDPGDISIDLFAPDGAVRCPHCDGKGYTIGTVDGR
jgi:hypothetical protein